jgi:clusterin-associated protein 1
MSLRYDPSINVSDDIDSEQDRVDFLTSIAHVCVQRSMMCSPKLSQVMLTRARIKLNTRRLYASNGLAVKELLKVATMLYRFVVIMMINDVLTTLFGCHFQCHECK